MPRVNVLFSDGKHAALKVRAATMDTSLQELVELSVDFATLVIDESIRRTDGEELVIGDVYAIVRTDSASVRRAWAGIDAHLAFVRALKLFVEECANSGCERADLARALLLSEPAFRTSLDEEPRSKRRPPPGLATLLV